MFKDVINHMDLSVYAEVPLIIFLGVFVAVVIRVMRGRARDYQALAHIPLDDTSDRSGNREQTR